jgi:ATP synthase protein I
LRLGLDLSRLFLTDHGEQAVSHASDSPENRPAESDPAAFVRMVVGLLRTQAVLAVAASAAAAFLGGASAALAVIAGGGVGIVLTAVAALRVGAAPADVAAMTAAFYRGMATKLALAVVLFVVVAIWFAQWFMPVLTGYVATLVAYWVALIRIGRSAGGA